MNVLSRSLVVVADDFGIGPDTSRGILDLADQGIVTATVLLVNSPYAWECVQLWRARGSPLELGWHPCLTIDAPILPPWEVPSLVNREGKFYSLGELIQRLFLGKIRTRDIEAEFRAQHQRFQELTGTLPTVVNSHHHIQVFPIIGNTLRKILREQPSLPWLRQIREPWSMLRRIPGAVLKRTVLCTLGRFRGIRQQAEAFPGSDWTVGITDPAFLEDPDFFGRWIRAVPGNVVELTCHPGYLDLTIPGRDGTLEDGQVRRRPRELELLQSSDFVRICSDAGFRRVAPAESSQITPLTARRILRNAS